MATAQDVRYAVRMLRKTPRRLNRFLVGAFAASALILCLVGIYGVVSDWVAERTHEIGLQLALGAEPAAVLGLVLRDGLRLAIGGVAIGMVAAAAVARLLGSFLFGIGAYDPLTFGAALRRSLAP